MPIACPNGEQPRYRVKQTNKGQVRLAFCGSSAVEAIKLKKAAKKRRKAETH